MQSALKVPGIGEYAKAGRASGFVAVRDQRGVKVGLQQTAAGRCFFDFGDDGGFVPFQRFRERPYGRFPVICFALQTIGMRLQRAMDSGARIIGVNNRDLRTFTVTLDTSLRLSYQMPSNVIRVTESGIFTHAHIAMLRDAGFDAFLVGESLMKSGDPSAALLGLRSEAHVR